MHSTEIDTDFIPDVMNTDIFRLAAVLYADSNYEVNTTTIHRKIIESFFVSTDNNVVSIYDLSKEIQERYNILLEHIEIRKVVEKSENFITTNDKANEINISLTAKRFAIIQEKISGTNLDHFIDEFNKINTGLNIADIKDVIYLFLYEVFKTNLTSFSKLVDSSLTVDDIINVSDQEFNPIQIEIINSFINWDNPKKNKAIFDISNIALEYCLISNKKGNSFKLENLKNKNFYLDTNILFRAIGLNGENRKNKTLTFLEKFREAKENLIISKYTEEEFRKTVKFHVTGMGKRNNGKINSRVFLKHSKSGDLVNYYHKWRASRVNDSLELFEAYIMSELHLLIKRFSIVLDYKSVIDMGDQKLKDIILDTSSQINTYKSSEKNISSYLESNIIDAQNIHIINEKRGENYSNLFDCKYFMISSDQYLQKWDYTKNKVIPIVILPSQWMSILLRYLNRTDDDFKSFVSFLNINSPDKIVSNENLNLILMGISEITQDFTSQNNIVSEMIGKQFKGIIDKNTSDDEIISRAKAFAKTKLDRDLEEIQAQNKLLENKFEKYQTNTTNAIESLKKQKNLEKAGKENFENENKQIKAELVESKVKLEYVKFKIIGYICLSICACSLLTLVLTFFYTDREWNIINVFRNYADSIPENSVQRDLISYIYLLLFPIIGTTTIVAYRRLFDPSIRKKKKKELHDKYNVL